MNIFKHTKTIKIFFKSFMCLFLMMTMLVADFPVDGIVQFLRSDKVVDSLYLAKHGKNLANIVDNFNVREASAANTRVKTIELFGGQYLGTGQNVGVAQTFAQQTAELAETNADIVNAYVEFSAEIGGTAALTSTEALLYFDACTPTPCAPSVAIMMHTAGLGTNSGESQNVRFRADVTSEATLAAYTGGGADFSYQIGYCIDGATGTDAGTCNGTSAVNLHMANARLFITYTYDDDSATQTNTVIYPLDNGSEVGSKVAAQVACTFDSNCPTFNYNAQIPEIDTQISQFFHLQTSLNANNTTDWSSVADIGTGANSTAAVYEEALAHNGGWVNVMHSGLAGYANNSSQSLEFGTNGSNAYVMGGENIVTYTYANNAATKTRTTVYPVGEVMTAGTTTETAQVGPTVYFPESGVDVKAAWFRVQASSSVSTSTNLMLTYQVGGNAKSAQRTYAFATDTVVASSDGYLNFLIPASEYTELEAATGSSGKAVLMTADWSTARGNVSAELVVTYTYTGESNGYNVTQKLFAGQQTTAPAAVSLSLGTIDPKIPEASDTAITGVSLKMDAKGAAFAAADELLGSNLHASSCTATGSSTVDDITELDRYGFFKSITGVVTTNDATTYIPCYDTGENAVYGGHVTIIYKYVPPAAGSCSSTGSTAWATGSTWTAGCNGAGGIPNVNDSVTILNTHNVTIATGVSAVAENVTVNSGGTLTITSTGALTMDGNLTNSSGGTITGTGALNLTGTTKTIDGSGSMTGLTGLITITGDKTINSTASLSTGGGLTLSSGTVTQNSSSSITVAGTTTITGTWNNSGTFTASGTFTGGGSWTNGTNSTLNLGGATTNANAVTTFTATASGNTVNYNGGTQTLKASVTHVNLTLSGSGAKTFPAGTTTVNGVLSIENGTNANTFTGSLAYGASATLQYNAGSSARTASTEWVSPFVATGGVIIKGTGAITMGASKQFGNNTSVPFTMESGSVLTPGTNTLTFHGDYINNGGTWTAAATPVTIAGTVSAQNIAGYTTTGLTSMTKTSGTATFTGDVDGGALTINGSGGTLNLGSSLSHVFTGAITLTAGTLNGGSSNLYANGTTTSTWVGTGSLFSAGTGTVIFSGANQTLSASATTFNNLTFVGSGTKTFTSATVINGTFTNGGSNSEFINNSLYSDGNLVSYYRLENTSDSKGSNTLTNNGSTPFNAAKFNNGGDLGTSNTTKYFSANNMGIAGNGNITVSEWVKVTAEPAISKVYIFAQHASTTGLDRYIQMYYQQTGGGVTEVVMDPGGVYNHYTTFLGTSSWHHFAMTRDVATNTAKLYVDGTLRLTSNLGSSGQGNNWLLLGRDATTSYASAILDDVAVFNRKLSFGEINDIYSSGASEQIMIATGNVALTFGGDFINNGVALNAGSSNITIAGTGTQSIAGFTTTGTTTMTKTAGTATLSGAVSGNALTIDGVGGTLSLGTGLTHTFTGAVTLTNGTLSNTSSNISMASLSSSNANTRVLTMGSGTWTLTSTGTVWDTTTVTGLTVNANTSTIKLTNNSASLKTFSGGGKTYNNFWFAPDTGTGTLEIRGSNTFNDFEDDGSVAHSIWFTTGTTNTFTTFSVSGNIGQLITISSSDGAGSVSTGDHTLSDTTGTNAASYLNIQHSDATGGATWTCAVGCVNNNSDATAGSGWVFTLTRYWVGGGGNAFWSNANNWSATSGGAGGAGIPDSNTDVIFNSSGNVASNLAGNITIKTLVMTGYTQTLTHDAGVTLTIAGDTYTLASGMTYTLGNAATSATTFTSTTGTSGTPSQLTFAGKTLGNTTFNGSGGYFQLNDSLTANTITTTAGNLLTNTTLTIESTSTGDDFYIARPISKNAGADSTLTIKSGRSIIATYPIGSTSNKLHTIINADADGNGEGVVSFAYAGLSSGNITTNGGNITIGGGSGTISAGSGYARGYSGGLTTGVIFSSVYINAGGGNIIVNGQGDTGAGGMGVSVDNYDATGEFVTSGNGTITINGIGTAGSLSGYIGVRVFYSGSVSSENGLLTINGTGGGSGVSTLNHGVSIESTGTVKTTGTGSISVTGIGGNASGSGGSNYGVYCATANCIQTTGGTPGSITVNGTGGNGSGSGTNNYGVYVATPGSITGASGSNVSITGTGGASSGNGNVGIRVNGASAVVSTSGAGTLTLSGTGAGSTNSASDYGIEVSGGGVVSSVNGNLTINNTVGGGAGSGANNNGLYITGTNSTVKTTGTGNISITATGGNASGSGGSNYGVLCAVANCIQTTGGTPGSITVNGTGGSGSSSGSSSNMGVTVSGVGSSITGASGSNVFITGLGGGATGASTNNFGVYLIQGSISTSGSGTVTLSGTGGGNGGTGWANYGVYLYNGGTASSVGGLLTVTGTGGGSNTNQQKSVYVAGASSSIKTTGSGNIIINGIPAPGGSGGTNYGVQVEVANGIQTTSSGTITVNTDTINLTEANDINSVGALTIAPYNAATTTGVAGGVGTLQLSSTYLGYLTSTSLQIGTTSTTGTIDVGAYASWAKPITFAHNASGSITISGAQTNSSTFTFNGPASLSADITASGLTISSGTFTPNAQTITLTGTGTVFSNAGTYTAGTSTIKLTNNSASLKTFSGGGGTYNNFWFAPSTGTGTLEILGSNTFNDFKDDGNTGHSILFAAGTTQTVTTFTVVGPGGPDIITINSSNGSGGTSTSTHALVKAGGGIISSDYLNIQHSVATPADTWYAGANSTNNQGVSDPGSGWIFTAAPCISQSTGTWNTVGRWSCGRVPTTGDAVNIASAHTVTMDVNSAVLGAITINGILNTSDGTSRALSGTTINISSTGTLTANASTITLSGTSGTLFTKHATGVFTAGTSSVVFSGNGDATLNSGTVAFNSVTNSGTGTKTLGGNVTVGGNLTLSAGTLALSTYDFTVTGTSSITGTLNDASATGTNLFTGAVTLNSGSTWSNSNNPAFEFRGGLTVNSTSTFSSGSGVYTFSTNAQSIGGTQSYTITNLTNNVTTGSLGLYFSGTSPTVTNLTQGTNAKLSFGSTNTVTTLDATASGNTVFYMTVSQTIKATTYNNLYLVTGDKIFPAGTTTVNGTLTIGNLGWTNTFTGSLVYGASATLEYNNAVSGTASTEWVTPFVATGGVVIKGTGAVSLNEAKVFNAGTTLNINAGATLTPGANLLTFNGDFVNDGTLTSGSGGVTIAGTATQSIDGFTTTGAVTMTKTAGTATLTSAVNGNTLVINGVGGTLNLGAGLNHEFTGTTTLTNGTINGGTSNIATSAFSSSNSNTRTVALGSGTWALTGTGTVWDMATSTNATVTPGTSTIKVVDTSSSNKTFSGGGKTYGNIWYAGGKSSTFSAVQTSTQVSGTASSAVITMSPTTAGNLVVVHVRLYNDIDGGDNVLVTSVTDNVGNNYVVGSYQANSNGYTRIYQAYGVQTIGGATSITVNMSSTINPSVTYTAGADEYSGGRATNSTVVDTHTSQSGASTTPSVPTLTTASTGELVVATGGNLTQVSWTAGENYTNYNGSGSTYLRSQYRLSSSASETAPWTISSGTSWAEIARAFKPMGPGTGSFIIVGDNTFKDFKDDGNVAHSILFTAGSTTHVTSWHVSGTAGQLITINSTDNSSAHFLIKDGGGAVNSDYLNIQHSVATPMATWFAGINSVDNQSVDTDGSGWIFKISRVYMYGGDDTEASASPNGVVSGGGNGGGGGGGGESQDGGGGITPGPGQLTSGPLSPGTLANDEAVGTVAWGTTSNAGASDNAYATAVGNFVTTNYLKATNFGFSIPVGSIIDGIVVGIERKGDAPGGDSAVSDNAVRIVKADGSISSTNKSTGAGWPAGDAYTTFGSASEKWGETWTHTSINDSDFGVAISANIGSGSNYTASVDHIRITIYYTLGGAGGGGDSE